jgi:putative glutamine amidotransferase
MPFNRPHLRIGVSARIYHPGNPVFDLGGVWTRTLHYLEQSVAHWLLRGGALPMMIPAVDAQSVTSADDLNLRHYADSLDALVLQGGNDLSPHSYGEQPLDPAWAGDAVRDRYEMSLVHAFVDAGKPVFGICRGLQLLNVAFGGTLYQDIPTQRPEAQKHVNHDHYERNQHAVEILPGTRLAELYPGLRRGRINSIHHQAIKDLAPGLTAEARCPDDGIIEAVRLRGETYVAAVQWHPEFHAPGDPTVFDDAPMLRDFLQAARAVRESGN